MGEHLYKEGLRRCCKCKEVKALDDEHFHRSQGGHDRRGFKYLCKLCKEPGFSGDRLRVLEELGMRCSHCGLQSTNPSMFDIDHIVPLRHAGSRIYHIEDIANYMVLCPNCHRMKTLKDMAISKQQKSAR